MFSSVTAIKHVINLGTRLKHINIRTSLCSSEMICAASQSSQKWLRLAAIFMRQRL
jgi:seryl-tRNA(Sec) selenium transferase